MGAPSYSPPVAAAAAARLPRLPALHQGHGEQRHEERPEQQRPPLHGHAQALAAAHRPVHQAHEAHARAEQRGSAAALLVALTRLFLFVKHNNKHAEKA